MSTPNVVGVVRRLGHRNWPRAMFSRHRPTNRRGLFFDRLRTKHNLEHRLGTNSVKFCLRQIPFMLTQPSSILTMSPSFGLHTADITGNS